VRSFVADQVNELTEILIDIQDKLVPILDGYEQSIYYYLFRHTYLVNEKQTLFNTRNAEIGFSSGQGDKKPASKTRSMKLKSLEAKGCIKIVERSNKGMLVELILPADIHFLREIENDLDEINLESLDFYKDRRLMSTLLEREEWKCFYTGRKLREDNCYLDHVVPQSKGGDNTYKNIVASCFDANSRKNDKSADEFIRSLYKLGIISLADFQELKEKISMLEAGKLQPEIELVRAAIHN